MTAPLVLENRHTGERLEILRIRSDGEDRFHLRGSLPAGREGPPLHVHFHEDEEGVIRSGVISVLVDGSRIDARAGETVRLPRGAPHRWWNEGAETLEFDGITRPAVDLDRYLQAVFDVMNASPTGKPSLFYLARVALRHRRTQAALVMPRALQTILFPIVVFIGTIVGRYRGTEWPGCPSRCRGAPLVVDSPG